MSWLFVIHQVCQFFLISQVCQGFLQFLRHVSVGTLADKNCFCYHNALLSVFDMCASTLWLIIGGAVVRKVTHLFPSIQRFGFNAHLCQYAEYSSKRLFALPHPPI